MNQKVPFECYYTPQCSKNQESEKKRDSFLSSTVTPMPFQYYILAHLLGFAHMQLIFLFFLGNGHIGDIYLFTLQKVQFFSPPTTNRPATLQHHVFPDIIFTVPASRTFSVPFFIILKHYITYQIHKLIGFQVFEC